MSNATGVPDGAPPPPVEEALIDSQTTLDLRLACIFVVLVITFLGCIPPLFFPVFRDNSHPLTRILRAFAEGVILTLAIVHVLPEGVADFQQLTEYPLAEAIVIAGIILMAMVENAFNSYVARNKKTSMHVCAHGHGAAHEEPSQQEAVSSSSSSSDEAEKEGEQAPTGPAATSGPAAPVADAVKPQEEVLDLRSLKTLIMAYMFEFSCVTHSFLIGLATGVITDNRRLVFALLIALAFHQALEGLALGSMLIQAGFSPRKFLTMITLYSITTPVGIAVGIGIAGTYDPKSIIAIAVQGTFNSLSSGMLIYISLIHLLAADFGSPESIHRNMWVQAMVYVALCVGVGSMCFIAIWA
mmetsp:Transcript_18109/g.38967  ORF Transcript_18109/g.38967 Transcript_18109/m.38967 type:complete len:356 (-) Transcript_18109:1205-2272(-)|eukprot:CAMPEP_0202892460 /NCGR_PEP_ID=MMETSP1392-20130828/2183_1 /ASSEMBLY_ACC=CAM_ASM_000868 /TAXON_ID=225041 /ORGANISM="Chlamydomonas chlamydogama, Strain SAG 11-48b" /LENGTH=355 /DNA_ID=CAMNT_0049576417 /DNA_START=130 /DNA_END=1197 /DNA_ORIENTATION=-